MNLQKLRRWTHSQYGKGLSRVLLCVHLHAACRPQTLFDIAERRKITPMLSNKFFNNNYLLSNDVDITFLKEIDSQVIKTFAGDIVALERLAREFVEDCFKQGIAYVEVSFSPHLLSGEALQPKKVISTILDTFQEVGSRLGVNCRAILLIMRERPQDAMDVLDLVRAFEGKGIVAMGLGGDENIFLQTGQTDSLIVAAFQEAKRLGIRRMVNVGEIGTITTLKEAIFKLHAERIGHGYALATDEAFFLELKTHKIHVAFCLTWAKLNREIHPCWFHNPFLPTLSNKLSFSINTGFPLYTGVDLHDEYKLYQNKLDMTKKDLADCNLNAAENSFIHFTERQELIEHLQLTNPTLFHPCYCKRMNCQICANLTR